LKQIIIVDSDSDAEEDYVPPKNYDKDSDDQSDDNDSGSDDLSDNDLENAFENVLMKSKLDRKRKVKTSVGKYERKKAKVATSKKAKGPHDRLLEFPDNGLSVVNGQLSCRARSFLDMPLKKSSIQSDLSGELRK
jgi:hypothetical protein